MTSSLSWIREYGIRSRILFIHSDQENVTDIVVWIDSLRIETVSSAAPLEILDHFAPGRYDIVLASLYLQPQVEMKLLKKFFDIDPDIVLILLSPAEKISVLSPLLQYGNTLFVPEPIEKKVFFRTIQTALAFRLAISRKVFLNSESMIESQKQMQMGEMISMIAHQWRQPLSAITTVIGTLRTRMSLEVYKKAPDPYEACEGELLNAFEKIEHSAAFLSGTINDFRNFYSPNKPKIAFNVAQTIQKICKMVIPDEELEGIHLDLALDERVQLYTYESEFMQVIMNLINNARDAIRERAVADGRIFIRLFEDDDEIRLEIADNAKGIKEAIMTKIFEPYFSTKTQKNGTGLGLYMTKTIIESHLGGTISVHNDASTNGARFTIRLPKSTKESHE